MGTRPDFGEQIEASIRRVQEAIARGQAPHADVLKTFLAAAGAHALDRVSDKLRAKRERERLREERRRRRREEAAAAAKPQGFVFAAAALVMLYFAVTQPHLWWMVFIAFGFGMASAGQLAKGFRYDRLLEARHEREGVVGGRATDPALAQIDTRVARVDSTCERILAEIKSGPQVVREVVQRPEETLKALRVACHELARRERELRATVTAEDEQRLRQERAVLESRITTERDEVARGRLESALKALDTQLAQRAAIATSASRFEAEETRILYTLESLYTQILRARSADAASAEVAGAGLRRSVEQLGQEIDAVAEALESVNSEGTLGLAPVQEPPDTESRQPAPGGRVRS